MHIEERVSFKHKVYMQQNIFFTGEIGHLRNKSEEYSFFKCVDECQEDEQHTVCGCIPYASGLNTPENQIGIMIIGLASLISIFLKTVKPNLNARKR